MLITGANGFLASSVIKNVSNNWTLVALVRPGTSAPERFKVAYQSIDSLLSDLGHVDVVMHLAACIPRPIESTPDDLMPVNVGLVEKLVSAYPQAFHLLASSVSVFGTPTSLPITIKTPPNQPTAYGISKLKAEEIVNKTKRHAIIRFSSIIGRSMRTGSFIPTLVSSAKNGVIHLYGEGDRQQNYIDVDDAAQMCLNAISNQQSILRLGVSDRSYSNLEVARILASLTGAVIKKSGIDFSPSYVYDLNDSVQLDRPHLSLIKSLQKMVLKR